ncbi:MAG: PD40 domain-containing protein [Bacteroidetes bacterium]|nr:PD40 domain-containing protein [Bacteroidota bacterium]
MKNNYHTISIKLVALIALYMCSCRSYNVFNTWPKHSPISNKLNPITPKTNSSYYDLSYLFKNEVDQNINQLSRIDTMRLNRDDMGSIEFDVTNYKKNRNPLISLFCFATSVPFRAPALLGIPVGHRRAVVDVSVNVRDANQNIIKTYTARGKHVSIITCYWGYKSYDAQNKAHDKAFYKALNQIKHSIDADAAFLNTKLPTALLNDQEMAAKQSIQNGNKAFKAENYATAIANYTQAITTIKDYKPNHAKLFYNLGYSYLKLETDDASAEKYLDKALELDPKVDYMAPVGLYLIAKSKNNYADAIKWLDYTSDNFASKIKLDVLKEWRAECVSALPQINAGAELKKKPVNVQVHNLGSDINGKEGDYFPSITADESMLLFTSRRSGSTGGLGSDGQYDEDLWYCTKNDSGKWNSPKNFGPPVNTKNNNGIASFTGDGQYVVCGRCGESDGYGSCDIYGAVLHGNTWEEPKNLGSNINSKEWDAQVSISADGKTLVFCSSRSGGYGDEDIWMARKGADDKWLQPKNLGSTINTSGNEYSPYLHPDGKTLYFSSNNLSPRIGGVDIYKTTMKDDGTFTTPENLGYPINSEKDDKYFVLSPSGLKGYFASNRDGGYGKDDIYEIIYPQEMKSKLTTLVGYVLDDETKQPVEATITIDDLDSAKAVGAYISNSATGKFVVILAPGHNYALTVSKKGYLFYSENFNIHPDNAFKEVKKEVLLQKLKEGKKIVLNNIFFETAKSTLSETSNLEIQKVYELMLQNPKLKVEISGHTDNVGNDQVNTKLSHDRASVVVQMLINKGIAANRMVAKGYGKNQPYGPNDTEEQRALNRRTEFKIISSEN